MIRGNNGFIPAFAQNRFLKEGSTGSTAGNIISIESYPNQVPTFSWMSASGHIFFNLPSIAFVEGNPALNLFCDFHCPSSDMELSHLPIEGPGWGVVNGHIFKWKRYITTADWVNDNWVAHLVITYDNCLIWIRNSKFQVGGSELNLPDWDKQREDWRIL
mgnify:CR=1 FL=1